MVISKVLNSERLKKRNREKLASRLTCGSFLSSLTSSFHHKFKCLLTLFVWGGGGGCVANDVIVD